MPKKRQSRAVRQPWEEDEVYELMAWLDYCLAHSIDFQTTVVEHLNGVTGKPFNKQRVDRKLKREYENYGREGQNSLEDFLSEGSSFLESYIHLDRKGIHLAFERLEVSPPRKYLTRTWTRPSSRNIILPRQRGSCERPGNSSIPTSEVRRNLQVNQAGYENVGESNNKVRNSSHLSSLFVFFCYGA